MITLEDIELQNSDNPKDSSHLLPLVLRKYSALVDDVGYAGIESNSSNARFYTNENILIYCQ